MLLTQFLVARNDDVMNFLFFGERCHELPVELIYALPQG
jgi:hypothetical protein